MAMSHKQIWEQAPTESTENVHRQVHQAIGPEGTPEEAAIPRRRSQIAALNLETAGRAASCCPPSGRWRWCRKAGRRRQLIQGGVRSNVATWESLKRFFRWERETLATNELSLLALWDQPPLYVDESTALWRVLPLAPQAIRERLQKRHPGTALRRSLQAWPPGGTAWPPLRSVPSYSFMVVRFLDVVVSFLASSTSLFGVGEAARLLLVWGAVQRLPATYRTKNLRDLILATHCSRGEGGAPPPAQGRMLSAWAAGAAPSFASAHAADAERDGA